MRSIASHTYSKSQKGWYKIGGKIYFLKSGWEIVYARCLQWQKERGVISEWSYEPATFWFQGIKRGVTNYTPDFLVTFPDGSYEYHEVKGYMDGKSVTKIKRMAKYFPEITLVVVDKDAYKSIFQYNRLYPQAKKMKKVK